jgi:hypothetical protein
MCPGEMRNHLQVMLTPGKRVNVEVTKAGKGTFWKIGKSKILGKWVKKLDLYANVEFIAILRRGDQMYRSGF